ncbi:MAG: MFS transporter [Halanaeroarchaeum sp.]
MGQRASVDRSWRGVGGVATWQLVASASYYGFFAATAGVRTEFGLTRFQIGLLLATLTLGYTALLFPAGALVDAYGDRPVMIAGLLALAIGVIGVGLAPTVPVLAGAVFLLGGAYATAMPATNRAIAARAPRGRYNLAINVKQVGVTLGSAVAALLVTNMVLVGRTWRTAFVVVGVLGIGVVVAGTNRYENTGGTGSVSRPDLPALRGNRPFVLLTGAGFCIGATIFTTTGYLVPFVEDAGGSVRLAGFALATMQVSGSVGRLGAGALADRLPFEAAHGAYRVMGGQLVVACLLLLTLPFAPGVLRFPVVIGLGLGMLGLTGLYHGTIVGLVPEGETGAATAGAQTAINLGGLLTPPVFGLIADLLGYRFGWMLLGGIAFVGLAFVELGRRSWVKKD